MKTEMEVLGLVLISVLLTTAGVAKVADVTPLAHALPYLVPIRPAAARRAARALAAVELGTGTLVLLPAARHGAVLAAMGLATLFAAAGLVARALGVRVACGCFGSLLPRTPPLGLVNVAIAAAILGSGWLALSGPGPGPGPAAAAVALSLGTLVVSSAAAPVLMLYRRPRYA